MSKAQQTAIGLTLAVCVISAWSFVHIGAIFWLSLNGPLVFACVPLILLQTWLGAGLFIVAHDAMHGSLTPAIPPLNRGVGRLALSLYAFFPYDMIVAKHMAHHRHSGRQGDPDFHVDRPESFWPWYTEFFRQYFGLRQLMMISITVAIYYLFFHAKIENILLFWAAPSLLSSLQLFTFGTWLPHRHQEGGFCDDHNARSLDYRWLASLAACYHFGYHVDHHRSPQTPWWFLPAVRSKRLSQDLKA